jgi:hypothetical protein
MCIITDGISYDDNISFYLNINKKIKVWNKPFFILNPRKFII